MVHYETFSTEGIKSFGKIFLDLLATLLSNPSLKLLMGAVKFVIDHGAPCSEDIS